MKLLNNETISDKVSKKSLVGFRFIIRIVHTTLNTAFVTSASLFDFTKLRFGAQTKRGTEVIDNVRSTPIKPILKHLALRDTYYANIIYNTKNVFDEKVTQTASAYHQLECNFEIPFDGGIVLKGTDELEFTATINEGFFKLATMDTAKSYVKIEPIVGVTEEFFPPMIVIHPIKEGAQNPTFDIGDNVTELSFVNMSDADLKDTNRILVNAHIKSDVYNDTRDSHALIAAKNVQQDGHNTFTRDQSYMLIDAGNADYDRVIVQLDLEESKVTLSDNYLVVFQKGVSATSFNRQVERTERQELEKQNTLTQQLASAPKPATV